MALLSLASSVAAALLLTASVVSAELPELPERPAPGQFTVVIDAAHGGPDPGTQLTPQLAEKAFTLKLSVLLRSALAARGMQVATTREMDTDPPLDDRAAVANHAAAQACLVLHATASGSGVHLYTSSLSPAPAPPGLVRWNTAAAPFITLSLKLSSDLSAAFLSAGVPYTLGRVQLAPLDSMECPTVAIEVAPLRSSPGHDNSAALTSSSYQQQVVNAIAAGLVAWRADAQGEAAR